MWLGSTGQQSPIKNYNVLKPILKLKGRVEYFKVGGDLPTKYLKHICDVMDKDSNPSVPMKIMWEREEKVAADRKAYLGSEEINLIWKAKGLKMNEEAACEECLASRSDGHAPYFALNFVWVVIILGNSLLTIARICTISKQAVHILPVEVVNFGQAGNRKNTT